MKIILAQGNPGAQYATSRHNVGFMTLDALARRQSVAFVKKAKFHADIAETTIAGERVLLVKPTTFYNETGQTARMLLDFYKCDPTQQLLVIHDDLALPFGSLRIRQKGSDAGNNGIKSINAHVGQLYSRIRIGVYSPIRDRIPDADFVLSTFNLAESAALANTIIPKTIELIQDFCNDQLANTSHSLLDLDPQ